MVAMATDAFSAERGTNIKKTERDTQRDREKERERDSTEFLS